MESMVRLTAGRSRALRARTLSSRSLRVIAYGRRCGLPVEPFVLDFGRLMGPLHSVVTVARIGSAPKSKSLAVRILGAILGVDFLSQTC